MCEDSFIYNPKITALIIIIENIRNDTKSNIYFNILGVLLSFLISRSISFSINSFYSLLEPLLLVELPLLSSPNTISGCDYSLSLYLETVNLGNLGFKVNSISLLLMGLLL